MTISDGFKKLTLAAIGAGAITYEKTSEILGHLVEKGEITVDQGKIINSELKHNVKESVTNQKEIVKEAAQKVKEEAEENPQSYATSLIARGSLNKTLAARSNLLRRIYFPTGSPMDVVNILWK